MKGEPGSRAACGLLFIAALAANSTAGAVEWAGYLAAEWRGFQHRPLDTRQHRVNASLVAQPELWHEWDDGRQSIAFVPFLRVDQHDEARTHFDIRELTWLKVARDWELRLGIRKVFWGVTESQHLVDIINQTDLVESPDGEEKLGQPMVNLALIRDWGTVDLFVLPGFRERTFPGIEGRLRSTPQVDDDAAIYESGAEEHHIDLAVRWSHSIGDWDLGLSHFAGTSREPRLLLGRDQGGNLVLVPRYDQIHQTGIDVQATKGEWLWKLEAIRREGQGDTFAAATGGFEYTFFGVAGTAADLGVLAEYLYDSRGRGGPSPTQDDLLAGLRLTLNDVQSTELLFGVIQDLDGHGRLWSLEASRRLGDRWKLSLEGRIFSGAPVNDPVHGLRADDYVQLELARFF